MLRSIKSELWKAFHNRYFCWTIILGVSIAAINNVENMILVSDLSPIMLNSGDNLSKSYQGFSLFINWMAVNATSVGSKIFYFIWPILAAMPFGWSYYQDRKTGLYNQLVSRSNPFVYFTSKYTAVFISGGIAVATPVLINLLINAMICPYCVPKVITSLAMVFDGNFLSELFYTQPWIYAFVWCFIDFVWGGVTACICFLIGTKPKFQVIVMLMPFIVYFIIDYLYTVFLSLTYLNLEVSPLKLAVAASANQNPEWLVVIELCLVFVITYIGGYFQVKHNELV